MKTFAVGLTGANCSFAAPLFNNNEGDPPKTGQFFIAFDPDLSGRKRFSRLTLELFNAILDQDGTQLPCDERVRTRKESREKGVATDKAPGPNLKPGKSVPLALRSRI